MCAKSMKSNLVDPLLHHMTGKQLAQMMTTSSNMRNRIKNNHKLMARVKTVKRYHNEAIARTHNRLQRAASRRYFNHLVHIASRFESETAERGLIDYLKSHNKNSVSRNGFTLYGKTFELGRHGSIYYQNSNGWWFLIRPHKSVLTKRNLQQRNYMSM